MPTASFEPRLQRLCTPSVARAAEQSVLNQIHPPKSTQQAELSELVATAVLNSVQILSPQNKVLGRLGARNYLAVQTTVR
jgi:hypothetical protein